MPDPAVMLAALQYGDSAFPSGGFAFSWGLEGLAADAMIATPDDVGEVIGEHLSGRWASMDRVLLRQAYRAPDLDAEIRVDRRAEAATPSAPMRAGSRRAGRALLGVWARMGQGRASRYHEAIRSLPALGHLAVVQGLVFAGAGLPLEAAELLSGWAVVGGLAGAAVRLGLLGHVMAQETMMRLRPRLAALLAGPPPSETAVSGFTPLIDIAVARAAGRSSRLFST